ncbi:MAG: c-type cytochrome [Planctomycetes bacterium]|nr:c-type cytochrome [Planctomycetota bacterium]
MTRWFFLPALALGLLLFFVSDSAAQKKKKAKRPVSAIPAQGAIHDPANAVKNLDVHPQLQATLFASEPKITNPTNLDIDHRGRIWICDVMNYRGNNGRRPEGDRILILEDTDGDGVADTVKTFYQGRDIDSAMGICVLGNKVIVSASPNVFVFHFDENDKVTKKELLFTKTGIPQHDHSAHSFVFGPDGRLYWNFGNTGNSVHDKNGKPVIDIHGNVVNNSGKPYRQGMVFRCELDGSNFDVLGHNFRNNYEVAVDSFGTLWQSDNDDDGNRGVRINYVMEYGNFGYVDEITGAGWQAKRTNMEKEIPLRHWHLNDPGVVPNLLQTYQGSPTGICVYEGDLLRRFLTGAARNGKSTSRDREGAEETQIIHCDAGPSIVRCYPAVPDGAGYKVPKIVNILDGAKKNQWFRPADVCVAPDGSIFVTDWYDPGVGGHQQRDIDRGRVFRVAPPGVKYNVAKYTFDTIEGNIEALKSPNNATRYIAWTNLHKAGAKAEPALLKLYESKIPHERARALWILGRIEGKGRHYFEKASNDLDPNIRVVAIRLGRQVKVDPLSLALLGLARDMGDKEGANKNWAGLRERAIALRGQKHKEMGLQWSILATQGFRQDRWYLEALGIGADGNWDSVLDTVLKGGQLGEFNETYRNIVWRSRGTRTPELLASIITSKATNASELPRFFRAFDFQNDSTLKTAILVKLAFGEYADPARRNLIVAESVARLKNFDVKNNPKHAAALDGILDRSRGTTAFVEMVGKFNVTKRYPELLTLAQKHPSEQVGVDAIRVLLDRNQIKLIETALTSKEPKTAASTAQAIASAGHDKANSLLLPIIKDTKQDLELRRQATRALARNKMGAAELIKLAKSKQLAKDLEVAAGSALSTSTVKAIRDQAQKLFPQPTTKDKKPLPAISDLVKLKGNVAGGQVIFMKAGKCADCHQVNGIGKSVGPDLSEIGKKLSREAVFESILFPSASISHNFETYVIETKQGTSANGVLVSKTAAEVSIKGADAIVRTFKAADVDTMVRSPISLMPADLHQEMTTQELANLVEYLLTLREAQKK